MFHVELAPLGGIFGPLKSDLGVFWPFRGTDFIMGKNKNANFSWPDFQFQPFLMNYFGEIAFFVFLHYKINGSKGVFWP